MPRFNRWQGIASGMLCAMPLLFPSIGTVAETQDRATGTVVPVAEVPEASEAGNANAATESPASAESVATPTLDRCDLDTAMMALSCPPVEYTKWFKSCPDGEHLWWEAIANANGCQVRYGAIWRLAELAPSDKLVDFIASHIRSGEDAIQSTAGLREMVFFARTDAIAALGVINSPKSRALLSYMFTPAGEKEYTETWIDLVVAGYDANDGFPARGLFIPEYRRKVAEGLVKTGRAECRFEVETFYAAIAAEYEQIPLWTSEKPRTREYLLRKNLLYRSKSGLAYALALGDVIDKWGREKVLQADPFPGGELARLVEIRRSKY